jgi:hypothetical protein
MRKAPLFIIIFAISINSFSQQYVIDFVMKFQIDSITYYAPYDALMTFNGSNYEYNPLWKLGIVVSKDKSISKEFNMVSRLAQTAPKDLNSRDINANIQRYAELRNAAKLMQLGGFGMTTIPYGIMLISGSTSIGTGGIVIIVCGVILAVGSWIIDWIAIKELQKY